MTDSFRVRSIKMQMPRVGAVAANLWTSFLIRLLWVPLLSLPAIPLIIVGSYMRMPPLWIAGLITLIIEAFLLVRMAFQLSAFRRAASRTLGVQVGWNGPPPAEAKYIDWCKKKGIEPFQAAQTRQ